MQGHNSPPPEPGLAVAEVAKKLGVAPATLRTWDRRYGLAPTLRTAGSHRRYTATDIARLEVMRSHTLAGLAPGDAARIAVGTPENQLITVPLVVAEGLNIPPETPTGELVSLLPDISEVSPASGPSDGIARRPNLSVSTDSVSDDGVVGIRSGLMPSGGAKPGGGAKQSADSKPSGDTKQSGRPSGGLRQIGGSGDDQSGSSKQSGSKPEPNLRLLPGLPPDSPALRVGAAMDAALAFEDQACLRALRFTPAEADVVKWWTELAHPTLVELAKRVVISPPGLAPFAIAETAVLKALSEFLQGHDLNLAAAGQPSSRHPSRLKKLVLVVADPADSAAPEAHALAASVITGGGAARVVTGAVDQRRLLELVLVTSPAVLVLAADVVLRAPALLAKLREKHDDLAVFVQLPPQAQPLPVEVEHEVPQMSEFAELLPAVLGALAERG